MKKIISIILLSLLTLSLVAVSFFGIRQMLANREIAAELENLPDIAPQLQATSHLEIIPLYENAGSSDEYVIGHGVSYLVRTDSATVLMDVGHNPDDSPIPPFEQNMQKLGIDWEEIDRIVISHSHPDHVGGVDAWKEHTVSMGDFELPDDLGDRLIFVPTPVTFKGAIHATIPSLPVPDVATTGVIPYPEVFPVSLFEPKGMEQALVVYVAGEGLVLISGCGHPTLEKLVERAENLYGQPVIGVVGGLHYGEASTKEIRPHIQFLQARQPALIALSPHDSSPQILAAFEKAFPDAYHSIRVGESIQFPDEPAEIEEMVYPLIIEEETWLEYEVVSADNFQLLPGVNVQQGDSVRFEVTGSSMDTKMGLDMQTAVSYKVPIGNVYVNGEKVGEQLGVPGTIAVTFAYPVDDLFWRDYQAVEDNWNQVTDEQGLSYQGEIHLNKENVFIEFGYTEPGVVQVPGRDGPVDISIERGVFNITVDRDTGIMLEQTRDASGDQASYHLVLRDSNTDVETHGQIDNSSEHD